MQKTIIGIQRSKFIDGDILLKTEDVITRHTNDYSNEEDKFLFAGNDFRLNDGYVMPNHIFSPNYLITVERFVPALKVGSIIQGTLFNGDLECYYIETLMGIEGNHTYEVAHFRNSYGMAIMFQIGSLDTALAKGEIWIVE